MITEIINFTNTLTDDFKSIGISPKVGIHILLKISQEGNIISSTESIEFEYYPKKGAPINAFLKKCMQFQENAWCVNTNKCFDLPRKAIHTCSPFCVAFKKEHLPFERNF
jgi:CRISPR-associated protein Csh1